MTLPATHPLVPHAAPSSAELRLVLYGVRRMAAGGLADAHAANAFFLGFGVHYRRPLVLLRALMAEMSRTATTRLLIAPCCCPRMSAAERVITDVLATIEVDPEAAGAALCRMLHVRNCAAVFGSAQALAGCFADLGRPLAS